MEQNSNISEDVRKRLDCIDWDAVKEKCGISREAVEKNAAVASQLAYGQYTDLIPGVAGDLSGSFSLRAYPQGEGEPWKVKMYTMERPKTEADTLFLYGAKIPGEKVKKNLLEKTDWLGTDGTRKYGFANANSGYPVELTVDGKIKNLSDLLSQTQDKLQEYIKENGIPTVETAQQLNMIRENDEWRVDLDVEKALKEKEGFKIFQE